MTVIATDGRTIAADTLMCYSNERATARVQKLVRLDRHIFAITGSPILNALVDWYFGGARPKNKPDVLDEWTLLVIDPEGRMSLYSHAKPYPGPVKAPFAMGSGGEYALGAMYAGAPPVEAVEIACKLSVHCGGEITVFDIENELSS